MEDSQTQDSSSSTVRWSSPEAVIHNKYNTSSDVWSYGMVLFEIWSLGHKPFEDIPNQKVATQNQMVIDTQHTHNTYHNTCSNMHVINTNASAAQHAFKL